MKRTTVLSYSAGQDSWALLCLYAFNADFRRTYVGDDSDFLVLMADTGAEHPETYEHVEYTKRFCQEHKIEFVHLTADMGYHTGDWAGGLFGIFAAKSIITSTAFPNASCTRSLKIDPIYKFLNDYIGDKYGYADRYQKAALKAYARDYGKIDMWIGFSTGEERRAGKAVAPVAIQELFDFVADKASQKRSEPLWMSESITKRFPLIDLGMNRQACQDFVSAHGQPVPPPSLCYGCHWKSDEEVLWTKLQHPMLFANWVEAEARKIEAWGDEAFRKQRQKNFQPNGVYKNLGVGGKIDKATGLPITLPQRAQAMREKLSDMDDQACLSYLSEWRMSHGHSVCSQY